MEPDKLQSPDLNSPINSYVELGIIPPPSPENQPPEHKLHRYLQEKGISLPVVVAILIPILFVMAVYRYDIYGLFKKQNYSVEIVDSQTLQPLINAQVSLRGQTVTTDSYGQTILKHIKVGKSSVQISHLNYNSYQVATLVSFTNHKFHVFGLKNIGSEVKLSVINKITQAPVAGAIITSGNNSVMTSSQGYSTISLDA